MNMKKGSDNSSCMENQTSCTLGKHSTIEAEPPVILYLLFWDKVWPSCPAWLLTSASAPDMEVTGVEACLPTLWDVAAFKGKPER